MIATPNGIFVFFVWRRSSPTEPAVISGSDQVTAAVKNDPAAFQWASEDRQSLVHMAMDGRGIAFPVGMVVFWPTLVPQEWNHLCITVLVRSLWRVAFQNICYDLRFVPHISCDGLVYVTCGH